MPKSPAKKQTPGRRKAAKTSPTTERPQSPTRANKKTNKAPNPSTSHGNPTIADEFAHAEASGRSGAATARKTGGKRAAGKDNNAPATDGPKNKRPKPNQANADQDSIGAADRLATSLLSGTDDFDSDREEESDNGSANEAAPATQAPATATPASQLKGLTKAALIARLQALETAGSKGRDVVPKQGTNPTKGKRDVSSDHGSISSGDESSGVDTKFVRDADHVKLEIQKPKAKTFLKSDDLLLLLRRISSDRAEGLLDLGCLDLSKILSAVNSLRSSGAIKMGLKQDASSMAFDIGPLKRSPAAAGNPLLRDKGGITKFAHAEFTMKDLLMSPFKSPPGLSEGVVLLEALWCTMAALTGKFPLERIPVLCRAWASFQISAGVDETAAVEFCLLHTEAIMSVLKTEQRLRVTGHDGVARFEYPFANHKTAESWILTQYGDTSVTLHVPQVADLESALSAFRTIGSREEKALKASALTRWGKPASEQDQGKSAADKKKGGVGTAEKGKPKPAEAQSEELCRVWALSDYIGRDQKAGGCTRGTRCRWEHRLPASKTEAEQLVDYAKAKLEAKKLTAQQAASVKTKLGHLLE
jgi:hypothetical protein